MFGVLGSGFLYGLDLKFQAVGFIRCWVRAVQGDLFQVGCRVGSTKVNKKMQIAVRSTLCWLYSKSRA